jgi:hypothetical protein
VAYNWQQYQVLGLEDGSCVLLNTLSVANFADNDNWQKYTDRGNRSARRKPRFRATLSTTNVICNGFELKLSLTDEGLAKNRLDQ